MGKVDARRFKKRSGLLIFAATRPGALTASFINGICEKLMRGGIVRTSQLRDVELSEFVTTGAVCLCLSVCVCLSFSVFLCVYLFIYLRLFAFALVCRFGLLRKFSTLTCQGDPSKTEDVPFSYSAPMDCTRLEATATCCHRHFGCSRS